jgi:glycosyltransferase involved in cell wall biosynthesis
VLPLSVTIIAMNEADRIGATIRSVDFAAEVLVLDSGSEDDTVQVAEAHGARVIQTGWPGHVAQKDRAMREAQHDWVLNIDADETLSPELALAIQDVLSAPPQAAGFSFPRLGYWGGEPIRHGTWWPDRQLRLFDRRRARYFGRDPHDRVAVDGPVVCLDQVLVHRPYRNIAEHMGTIGRYADIFVQGCLASGRRAHWWDVVFRPGFHLLKALVLRAGVLDGVRGLCVAGLGALYVQLKWGRLYLAQQERRS